MKIARDGFVAVEQVAGVPPGREVRLRVALQRERPDDPAPIRAAAAGQRRGARFGPWKWVAIGVGAGLAATGGALHALAASGWADVNGAARHADGTVRCAPMTRPGAMDRQRSADCRICAAVGLYAAGGAAPVTGIVFRILDATGGDWSGAAAGAPALGPGPGEAGVAASWRF
ncbi:MAG: hypothetical protein FJ087_22650 [Deltaproteobacteria bacterium]|nr:hypothetical protein [Deltaproteobacteria bacterium]